MSRRFVVVKIRFFRRDQKVFAQLLGFQVLQFDPAQDIDLIIWEVFSIDDLCPGERQFEPRDFEFVMLLLFLCGIVFRVSERSPCPWRRRSSGRCSSARGFQLAQLLFHRRQPLAVRYTVSCMASLCMIAPRTKAQKNSHHPLNEWWLCTMIE